MNVWNIIASVLSGLIVCVPLVMKLVSVTKEAVREKNWNLLMERVAQFMAEAEVIYDDEHNSDRKQYVLKSVQAAAKTINYDLTDEDLIKVGALIDVLCTMARTVNGPGEVSGK